MITKIVKPSGGDYVELNAALAGETPLTDDLDLIVSGDITLASHGAGSVITMNGYTLRIYPDIPHNGNPGEGRTVYTHLNTVSYLYLRPIFAGGKIEVYGLVWTSENYDVANKPLLNCLANAGTGGEYEIYDNIFNCVNNLGQHKAQGISCSLYANQSAKLWNNKVYKSVNQGINVAQFSGTNTPILLENNNCDDCNPLAAAAYGGILVFGALPALTANAVTMKNNVCTNNGYQDLNMSGRTIVAYMDENSDSDGTAVAYVPDGAGHNNNSTTIVPSNEFLSEDYTVDNYLKISTASAGLKDTGILPVYALTDLAGIVRGLNGSYSRGCYELNEFPQVMNVLDANLYIIGKYLDEAEDSADDLLIELFPDTTTLLMENFEKTFNLSSEGTTAERRNRIVSAHRQTGGLSKAYFEDIGNTLGTGKYTVSIAEGTDSIPFIVHTRSRFTSPRGPGTTLPGKLYDAPFSDGPYHITVTVTGSASEPDLEKLYERLHPPWTIWSYTYIP